MNIRSTSVGEICLRFPLTVSRVESRPASLSIFYSFADLRKVVLVGSPKQQYDLNKSLNSLLIRARDVS